MLSKDDSCHFLTFLLVCMIEMNFKLNIAVVFGNPK